MTLTMVLPPKLYVGNILDAETFDGIVCCVLEKNATVYFDNNNGSKTNIRKDALIFPIFNDSLFEFDIIQLELLSRFVGRTLKNYEDKVIVHCGMGWERSPFAVSYILWRNFEDKFPSLLEAYEYVKKIHPETKNIVNWIPKWWKNLYFTKESEKFNGGK